jgi:hypothetical protein
VTDLSDTQLRELCAALGWQGGTYHQVLAEVQRMKAAQAEPIELSDERIDAIADFVVKGMEDGLRGFLKSWGWRQFARAILADCRGHVAAASATAQPEPVWIQPDHLDKARQAPFLCRVEPAKRDDFVPLYAAVPPPAAQSDEARDAARYRWLRQQFWYGTTIACVVNPRAAIKLGHDCPSLERLDEFIDAALKGA